MQSVRDLAAKCHASTVAAVESSHQLCTAPPTLACACCVRPARGAGGGEVWSQGRGLDALWGTFMDTGRGRGVRQILRGVRDTSKTATLLSRSVTTRVT